MANMNGRIYTASAFTAASFTIGKVQPVKRGRPSSMQRFKIKYTNTKGVIKTRNIKATSEARAMSEIKDMGQHHYTIVESLDDPANGLTVTITDMHIERLTKSLSEHLEENIERIEHELFEKRMQHQLEERRKLMDKWKPIIEKMVPAFSKEKQQNLAEYAQAHYSSLKDGGYDEHLTKEDWNSQLDSSYSGDF